MEKVDYFKILQKYMDPSSLTYSLYLPHVVLVTNKALAIGRKLRLDNQQLRFIEEASMLHDIGIIQTNTPSLGCTGTLPYILHGLEGRHILESEGLPKHALVCERHTGVGISLEDIRNEGLPLPERDMQPQSLEEKIICWADLFFSKTPDKIWIERTIPAARTTIAKYGKRQTQTFDEWFHLFCKP